MITHPFHPDRWKKFDLVTRRLNWGEDRVMYYDADRRLRSVPSSWTNVVVPDIFSLVAADRCAFRIDDLLHLANVLAEESTKHDAQDVDGGVK